MKHLILFIGLIFTCVSYAENVSYDTDTPTEQAVFDCDQDLNVTECVTNGFEATVSTYALHTVITFNFDNPYHNYGVNCLKGVDFVPCVLHKRARDNC